MKTNELKDALNEIKQVIHVKREQASRYTMKGDIANANQQHSEANGMAMALDCIQRALNRMEETQ